VTLFVHTVLTIVVSLLSYPCVSPHTYLLWAVLSFCRLAANCDAIMTGSGDLQASYIAVTTLFLRSEKKRLEYLGIFLYYVTLVLIRILHCALLVWSH